MKKVFAIILVMAMFASVTSVSFAEGKKNFIIGICNFVDDASLNQIIDNIQVRLQEVEKEKGVSIEVLLDNCNLDGSVMMQIIQNFIAEDVDLLVAIATPVALTMQGMTEDNGIPVIFAAVSNPLRSGLVATEEAPGANITGTSDELNTNAVFDLIFAADPEAKKIALLYNPGEDASTEPIEKAIELLEQKGVEYKAYTGTNISEVIMAVDSIIADEMDAVFTPTDNTIMAAELSIYEALADAGIPHYCGADSFALNGAFLGFGVDYANLGRETGNMIAAVLLEGADPATTPIMKFDNGTATVNTEIAEKLGFDFEALKELFAPYCTQVQSIITAESFEDLQK